METTTTRIIKFVVFSAPLVPSLVCSVYILLCVVYEQNLRRRANHVMIVIIIVELLELMCDLVPIALPYLYTGHVYSTSICLYWMTANYALQGMASWLMAWASIDRYLLIFHYRLRSSFVRHGVPLIGLCSFVTVWYACLTLTHPCEDNWFDGSQFLCGGPCFGTSLIVVTIDWILIVLIPAVLIVVFSLLLLGRAMDQKCRRRPGFQPRSFTWRQNRKLLVQLLAISITFLVTQIPLVLFTLVHLLGSPGFLIDVTLIWLYYTPYLIYLVTPFAYIATTKECRTRIWAWRSRVEPAVVIMGSRS